MSRKQIFIALSSTEAEHIALSDCGKEARWMRQMLFELRYGSEKPTVIYENNTGAISCAASGAAPN